MHCVIPPPPQYFFMAWCLVKHKENFTFTFKTVTEPQIYEFKKTKHGKNAR